MFIHVCLPPLKWSSRVHFRAFTTVKSMENRSGQAGSQAGRWRATLQPVANTSKNRLPVANTHPVANTSRLLNPPCDIYQSPTHFLPRWQSASFNVGRSWVQSPPHLFFQMLLNPKNVSQSPTHPESGVLIPEIERLVSLKGSRKIWRLKGANYPVATG